MAAGGVLFVGGQAGVGGNDSQRFESNIQLLSRDLLESSLESLAKFGLAGEHRDAAVGINTNPGIQERRLLQAAGKARRRSRGRSALILRESRRKREADDQGAATCEHAATVENHRRAHRALPWVAEDASAVFIKLMARCTARRMRMWVPHRHKCGSSSLRIS